MFFAARRPSVPAGLVLWLSWCTSLSISTGRAARGFFHHPDNLTPGLLRFALVEIGVDHLLQAGECGVDVLGLFAKRIALADEVGQRVVDRADEPEGFLDKRP